MECRGCDEEESSLNESGWGPSHGPSAPSVAANRGDSFGKFATGASAWLGSKWAFAGAGAIILIWGTTGPFFHYSDTWQLVINTGTTIVTFLMVFLIQNTQNRDARAINLKLNELIHAIHAAGNQMMDIEKLSDAELDVLQTSYEKIRAECMERRKRGGKPRGSTNHMKSLANPTRLKPLEKKNGLLQVIIETPAGCRNKFAFDPDQGIFVLHRVLPAGMVFPYDFGFLPQTLAPDGDPPDVLLLMDEPAFPGCAVRARLIGVIEGEQLDGEDTIRNDRIVAVAEANHMYANVRRFKDLPAEWVKELEDFFVNYHDLEGKKYRLLGCKGAEIAKRLIKEAQKAS